MVMDHQNNDVVEVDWPPVCALSQSYLVESLRLLLETGQVFPRASIYGSFTYRTDAMLQYHDSRTRATFGI